MKIEIEQNWLMQILQRVYEMREAQKEYFKSPNEYRLKVSKLKEAKVDQVMHDAIKHGYVKPKPKPNTSTPTLFT